MKLFAFGFGFTALRLVDIYADEFERISGTVRHAEKRDELHRQKLDAYLFDAVEHSEIASRIKEADVLLVSVPPGRSEDPVLSAFGQQIEASTARQVVYLSTVGVYGDHGGAWIDEDTAVSPQVDRAHARVTAERRWKDVAGDRLAVLRLAGIYGPRRNALARLRDGNARRIVNLVRSSTASMSTTRRRPRWRRSITTRAARGTSATTSRHRRRTSSPTQLR